MAKAIMLRVAEWAAWFPLEKDHAEPRLAAAQGITGCQVDEGERLVDIDVMPVMQREHHFPITNSDGQVHNVKHRLHVFRVTLASGPVEVPDDAAFDAGPSAEGSAGSVILDPGHVNRKERRRRSS